MQNQKRTEWEAYQTVRVAKMDAHGLPLTGPPAAASSSLLLDDILRGMNSRKAERQYEAMRAAGRLASTSPEQLLQLAQMEALNYQRYVAAGTLISLSAVGLTGVLGFLLAQGIGDWKIAADMAMWLLGGMCIVMACWLNVYLPRRARANMIGIYRNLDDPRFIGLALSLLVPDGVTESRITPSFMTNVYGSICQALTQMLLRVHAGHKTLLTRKQMQILLSLLMHPKTDTTLTLAILRALQQIGDETAIPAVERVARAKYGVHSEAMECLEYLRGQADQKRQGQTLLRASDSTTATKSEHMLRPADPITDAAPEQLLRPQV